MNNIYDPKKRANVYRCSIDMSNLNTSHTQIINKIAPNSNVLDVGCANGELGSFLHHEKNCKVWGIEYNQESINIALTSHAYESIKQIDLNSFSFEENNDYNCLFDHIVFGDVLEHLINPSRTIQEFKSLLMPDGSFIMSLPNVAHISIKCGLLKNDFSYTEYGILDKTHLRFFTYLSISKMLAELSLQITDVTRVVSGLKGSLKEAAAASLPREIISFAEQDEQSFVAQYVFKAKISDLGSCALFDSNKARLLDWHPSEQKLISALKY